MNDSENAISLDDDYTIESDMPLFKKATVYSFEPTGILWADTWIIPLQAKDNTFSFLLIDSKTYRTLNSQEHFLTGFSTAKEAIQAAHFYLGQCANRFLATFDMTFQEWPPFA